MCEVEKGIKMDYRVEPDNDGGQVKPCPYKHSTAIPFSLPTGALVLLSLVHFKTAVLL